MRKCIGLGLAVVLALGFAVTASAEEGGAKKPGTPKTGVVKKVDAAGKKVTVMVTRELTFTVTDATKIVQGDAAKALADIKEGDTVTVEYSFEGQDRVASKITLGAPAAPKPQP